MIAGIGLWGGLVLVFGELRWFRRSSLAARLRPYTGHATAGHVDVAESFADLVGPFARTTGDRLSRWFGVTDELELRLDRFHADYGVEEFRTRQLGTTVLALGAGVGIALVATPPAVVILLLLLGSPLLAFLILEQRAVAASARWQRRIFLELPVIAEQLAMLLSAGYSLGTALDRLARRGRGACAADLRRVSARMQHGLTVVEALREWADRARVPSLDRLVPVLALNQETGDLGRLLSIEARALRNDVHRELVATMERRAQQVWVPVTVATLVPGVIFLSIPFIEALRMFSGS